MTERSPTGGVPSRDVTESAPTQRTPTGAIPDRDLTNGPSPAGTSPRRRRRALRALSTLLVVAGALVLADGVATLVWKEPVTAVYAGVQQERLGDELDALERAEPSRALVQHARPRRAWAWPPARSPAAASPAIRSAVCACLRSA